MEVESAIYIENIENKLIIKNTTINNNTGFIKG